MASISLSELADLLRSPYADELVASGTTTLIVDADVRPAGPAGLTWTDDSPGSLPIVIIGVREDDRPASPPGADRMFDVVLAPDDPQLDAIIEAIGRNPLAATALAVLLRSSEHLSVEHALAAESAVYSVLQSGPEFASWRAGKGSRRHAPATDVEAPVIGTRIDDVLTIELNRPLRHNAFSRALRDSLSELLALAVIDDSVTVTLSGRGPSFCSGGDLDEFGMFDDPATAHRTRLSRSPARLIHRLAGRIDVRLHGACMGAGIELAAFAQHVTAAPDARIALPEIELGLVPGAGGTVSLPRRIGRQRAAYLALSGAVISAGTALGWGLVDAVEADVEAVDHGAHRLPTS